MIINLWQVVTVSLAIILAGQLIAPTGLFFIGAPVKVELFIMSYCPYGTQALKGIMPAIQALGGSVDFKLRFVDYIMHGKMEIDENLREYCIQEEQPSKLLAYLYCFLEAGDSDGCLTSTGVNTALMDSCITSADEEFDITVLYNDQSSWSGGRYPQFNVNADLNTEYGVRGSPTLVINGEEASPANRSPQAFLDAICDAFTAKPAACSQQLSTQVPSTGFGFSGGSTAAGSCA